MPPRKLYEAAKGLAVLDDAHGLGGPGARVGPRRPGPHAVELRILISSAARPFRPLRSFDVPVSPWPVVKKPVLIEFMPAQMFEPVDRCEDYQQFLPWCGGAEVHKPNRHRHRGDAAHQLPRHQGAFQYGKRQALSVRDDAAPDRRAVHASGWALAVHAAR